MKYPKIRFFLAAIALTAAFSTSLSLSCQAQDAPPEAPQTDATESFPVGNQDDGIDMGLAGANKASIFAPTAIERNEKNATTPFKFAANGKALAPIIIAQKAGPETRQTAQELAGWLERMTKAPFAIRTPDGKDVDFTPSKERIGLVERTARAKAAAEARDAKPAEPLPLTGIVLGSADEFAAPELAKALEIRQNWNGREAFAIRPQAKRILLIAATRRGISHPVYRLLDEMGCRWFFATPTWEVIPSTPDLSFDRDITDRPSIGSRNIAFLDSIQSNETIDGVTYNEREVRDQWTRHNLLGGSLHPDAGHSWHRILRENADLLIDHPEYFAEVGGKRQMPLVVDKDGQPVLDKNGKKQFTAGLNVKFELANPAVRQLFVNYALNYFKQHPDADMVTVDPTDGGGHSESAESKALGSVSNAVFGMANEVARAVQQAYPGKMVGLLAYNYHIAPPDFPLEDNVYIEITAGFNQSKFSYAQLYEMWPHKAKNIGFYEYFSVFDWDNSRLTGGRVANISWDKNTVNNYAGMNAVSIFGQSTMSWGANGLGMYVTSKLMWNPSANVDQIIADFYEKAFGPAAPAMKRYYDAVSPGGGQLFGTNAMGNAYQAVDEATKLAKDRPDVLARLDDIKAFLTYNMLSWQMRDMPTSTAEDKANYRAKTVEMLSWSYVNRRRYMMHWPGISDRLGRGPAASLNDISLIIKAKRGRAGVGKFGKIVGGDRDAPNVWEGAQPPTPAEFEAKFQEGLKYFPPGDATEQNFNVNDLVAVKFPDIVPLPLPRGATEAENSRTDYYQNTTPYIFYSVKGEPIELEAGTGFLPQYRNRGAGSWTLTKRETQPDKPVAEGSIPEDQQLHAIKITVPGPGAYTFLFNARSSGVRLKYPLDKAATFTWPHAAATKFSGGHFYVPKGTKELHYFVNTNGGVGPHTVIAPDGKAFKMPGGAGEVLSLPIPAGQDGQVWRFGGAGGNRGLWFLNVPNLMAGSPQCLLVPRDIAEKDGLPILH